MITLHGPDGTPIYLESVGTIVGRHQGHTSVSSGNGKEFYVRESADEILKLIRIARTYK